MGMKSSQKLITSAKLRRTQTSFVTALVSVVAIAGLIEISGRKRQEEVLLNEKLAGAWTQRRESCEQWISAQRLTRAYLDFYLIGVQKGSTSELATRLWDLGVIDIRMKKSWEFLENLREPNAPRFRTGLHQPYTPTDLGSLRLQHFLSGFPHLSSELVDDVDVPLVDNSSTDKRKVIYDGSVESMLSDRVAFLAHALTPHAKVILTIREPISRALSEYNMMIRIHNRDIEKQGNIRPKKKATAAQFDLLMRNEMKKLVECGYDHLTGDLNVTTTELLDCVFPRPFSMEGMLFITRGLYHLHVKTWRKYFPAHRMMFMRFTDVTNGDEEVMKNLARFLCLRSYRKETLLKYSQKGSNVSYGVQAAVKGLSHMANGFDYYGGSNKYLVNIFPSTRKAMEEFYAPANKKLFAMMGLVMF